MTPEETEALAAGRLVERVHFIPQADDAELRLAYAGAVALVNASRMEGFGIPVIEALACGTGLILSDIPVYREIADPMAVFVPSTDVAAWAGALAAPVPVRSRWREDVLRRFQWRDAARVHAQAYAFACSQPPPHVYGKAG
jgi:glycosyltransferase involved in cell wall biosynthesis